MRARLLVVLAAVLVASALVHELHSTPVRLPRAAVMAIVAVGVLYLVVAGMTYEDEEIVS